MIVGHAEIPMDAIERICRKYRVKELSIFGSVLRDDFRSDSDIDLLVDFHPNHGLDLVDYIQCQEELAEALCRRVDLVDKEGLKPRLKKGILESARVVYAG